MSQAIIECNCMCRWRNQVPST